MNRFQRVILTISSFVVLGLLLNVFDSLKLYNLESKAGIKEFLFHTLLSGILFSLIWELIWPKFKRLIQKSIKDKQLTIVNVVNTKAGFRLEARLLFYYKAIEYHQTFAHWHLPLANTWLLNEVYLH